MKRILITVTPIKGGWRVKGGGRELIEHRLKSYAVCWAAAHCRALRRDDKLAQLRVWLKSGVIEYERTYGRDPRMTPG